MSRPCRRRSRNTSGWWHAHLVGQRLGADGERIGVRHLEDTGDAAHDGGAPTGLEVFLVLGPGLPQMHLAVHHAGEDMEPLAVEDLPGMDPGIASDPHDLAARNRHVAGAGAARWLTTIPPLRIKSARMGMGSP